MRARQVTIGILAVSGLLLAGCSSDDDPAASSTPTAVATVTQTVTETATPSPSASATTKPAGGSECAASEVAARVSDGQAGAGQRQVFLVLTNTSDDPCTVTGYPGLQLLTSTNAKVPTKVVRVSSPAAKTVTLKPNASASSTLTFGVVATGSEPETGPCEKNPSQIRVIPPDATTSVTAPWGFGPVCNKGKISANAFVAGNGS
jgi:hypothetical protein